MGPRGLHQLFCWAAPANEDHEGDTDTDREADQQGTFTVAMCCSSLPSHELGSLMHINRLALDQYFSQSTTEAFPMPGLQIPVGSFLRTVAGFPDETDSVTKQENTNKYRENGFNASCYDSGSYREVIFSLRRLFSGSKTAAIGGVFILTLPFHPWRRIIL
ncbi:hypothetical protein MG293_005704 [Ovis ammon polii]|uniref:Uncharacterized protein n=1 Tax=Ovis ammon polii TaxID=230172 RepID=A0AAD4UFU8_OVIAM|nr:hypothetical protein MG293_005704 [Ovis ammon polii]